MYTITLYTEVDVNKLEEYFRNVLTEEELKQLFIDKKSFEIRVLSDELMTGRMRDILSSKRIRHQEKYNESSRKPL